MIFDDFTIIGIIISLLAVLGGWVFNPFRRKIQASDEQVLTPSSQALSLVIITHDNADLLEQNLPLWINQQMQSDFQIIVVTDEGDRYAEDVIKRLNTSQRIHSTFVPSTSRYMSRAKLAVTLGVKAAIYPWVIVVDADVYPTSNYCLDIFARKCATPKTNLVLGMECYATPCRPFYQFEHLFRMLYFMNIAKRSQAFATNSRCIAFRKQDFMEGGGFTGCLDMVWGEYEGIVNKYSKKNATLIVTDEEARLLSSATSKSGWRARQLSEYSTRKNLNHGFIYKLLYYMDQAFIHFSPLALLAISLTAYLSAHWILLGMAATMFLALYFIRVLTARKTSRFLHIHLNSWMVPFMEIRTTWHNVLLAIRYLLTDKRKFTSHKL